MVRRAVSRTTANASGKMSSSVSPWAELLDFGLKSIDLIHNWLKLSKLLLVGLSEDPIYGALEKFHSESTFSSESILSEMSLMSKLSRT
jgi:hypothetical protein